MGLATTSLELSPALFTVQALSKKPEARKTSQLRLWGLDRAEGRISDAGVGHRDNVDLFSSSRDCFLALPHPSRLTLPLIHPHCLSFSERKCSPPNFGGVGGFLD